MGVARKVGVCSLIFSLVVVSGCASNGDNQWMNKENLGTAIGGAAGILIGSRIGSGGGRAAAMLIGGLAGGLLGKTIGAKMDEQDRQALALQTQQVLNNSQDGQTYNWQSAHSEASAVITPVSTQTEAHQIAVRRLPKIQAVSDMTVLNKPYRSIKSANLRNAPDSSAEKIGGLAANSTFTAIGKTHGDWIVVGRRGVTVGYVYAPLVQPVIAKPATTLARTATTTTPNVAPATDLDNLDAASAVKQGVDLDAIDAKPVEDQVSAQTTCRTVNYDVKAKSGDSEKQTVKACQAADGAWELI